MMLAPRESFPSETLMADSPNSPHSPTRVASLLFVSGFCALTYQVAWFRALRLIFGASTASNAAVLAIFMGGLGLGGWYFGPRVDRHERPLALYGRLELGIAALAALSPLLVVLVQDLYLATGGPTVLSGLAVSFVKLVLATVVLGGPVFLMGGTLPAAVRACQSDSDGARRSLALVYGANTLGSVLGSVLGTFLLIEVLGTRTTVFAAAGLNVLVALLAVRLGNGGPALTAEAPAPATASERPRLFALFAAASSGFAFFLMELVWYRMLGPILGGSVHTFGLILTFALLGIGLGGFAYSRRDRAPTVGGFAMTSAFMALCLALPFAAGDTLALLAHFLRALDHLGFYGLVFGWVVVIALVVLPASLVAGYQFPMLVALVGAGRQHVGRQVGLVYAWNTAGAIAGALAGGFGILPALSAPGAWRLVVLLLGAVAVLAAVLHLRQAARSRTGALSAMFVAALSAALVLEAGPTAVWRHGGIGAGRAQARFRGKNELVRWEHARRRSIVWEADGTESSVALEDASSYAFIVNGKVDGNGRGDAPTQIMLGLVGAALHPTGVKKSFVVGLGTGATAGWLGAVPSMERVDVVELEPVVLRVAADSAPVTHDALNDPKVNVIIGDAREVLPTSRETYDLIASEPSNPYRAGIASLFTVEFYEAVKERLAPGGLFVQWVQAYDIDARTTRVILTTLSQVFPHIETWEAAVDADMLLVASLEALAVNPDALAARLGAEPFDSALRLAWGVEGLDGFYTGFVANPGLAQALAAEGTARGELCTDDNALVEFGFARTVGQGRLGGVALLRDAAVARGFDRPVSLPLVLDPARIRELRTARGVAEGEPLTALPLEGAAGARQAARELYSRGQIEAALARWQEQREPFGDPRSGPNATDLTLIAEGLAVTGRPEAREVIDRLRQVLPLTADALAATFEALHGDPEAGKRAILDVLTRYRADPWPLPKLMGRLLARAETLARSDVAFAAALVEHLATPFSAGLHGDLRRIMRLNIGLATLTSTAEDGSRALAPGCVPLLAEVEPNVPWESFVLEARVRCYAAHAPELADPAVADLEAFATGAEAPLFP